MGGPEPNDSTCSTQWYYSLIPDSGKSGMGMGTIPPIQIGDGTPVPVPGQMGDGDLAWGSGCPRRAVPLVP